MRKYFGVVLAAACVLFGGAQGVRADAQDFYFTSFTGDYYLSRDSSNVAEMRVVENLVAQFPTTDQNHGIERAIPESYQNHPLELRVQSVADVQGKPLPYETRHENGNLVLRIGDADRYVHGQQAYVISYTMRGVANGDNEFYWDINGDQWPQRFDGVEARVHVPQDMARYLHERKACYAGPAGSASSENCTISYRGEADGGTTVLFANKREAIQSYQTLTVVLGFADGTFAPYSPSAWQIGEWARMAAFVALPPIAALGFVLGKWHKKGRDAKGKGTIVPQYLPPKGMSALGSNAVLTERFQPKAISATIIDLAVRHYIKIYETQPDKLFRSATYEVELVEAPDNLLAEERSVIAMIFSNTTVGERVKLEDLKNRLALKAQHIGKQVDSAMAKQGYFVVAPSKAKTPYYAAGIGLVVVGVGLLAFTALFLGIGIMLAGIVLLIAAHTMPARTAKGVQLRDYLLGLRDYMQLAEADRLRVLQSPNGRLTEKVPINNVLLVKLYERLLPYAMLFGIEKDWAKQLAGLYSQAPDWYSGQGTFNAVWFASSLSGFSTRTTNAFAPPSSSGSGVAGGGGGGGGGGGW